MEYILALLFTFKYIIGHTGNTDLLYLFAAVALLFYVWRRRSKVAIILKAALPLVVVCIGMAIFYPQIVPLRVFVFLGKMILNITFAIFIAYNRNKWNMTRFVKFVVLILGVETGIAFLLPNSQLWTTESLVGGAESVARLRLFYPDAGALSFVCGFILILLVYQLITEEVVWHQAIGVVIILVDLYLSYGISGMTCALIAVVIMLVLAYMYKYKNDKIHNKKKFLVISGISFASVIAVVVSNSIYSERAKNIADGSDYILIKKLCEPLSNIGKVLNETKFLGVGFGNANTSYALDIMNVEQAYPNSFLRLIAEGGVFGIVLVLFVVCGLLYVSARYGSIVEKSLCAYVLIYQFVGGYFTDPTNFFIYGLIIGAYIKNKNLIIPVVKDKLWIAEIGHKRLFGREGGVEIVVEEISKRLVAEGHRVDAYDRSGDHVSGAQYNSASEQDNFGINIITIPTIQKKGFAALIYSFIASIYASVKKYDVIHYHAEGPCAFIWIPSLFGIRTVATIHGLDWQRTGKWGSLASQFIKFGEKMAVEYANEIIVLSKQVQNYFLTTYNRKTNFIPNGVDRPETHEANEITKKWGLTSKGYILCLARLTSEKGFHYAIEAFKNIDTDKKLVIAGGASDTAEYVQSLKSMAEGDDRIIFTGFVHGDILSELYSNAYVYCLPSDLEGMPISLLEAMAYGNCCLVSDIPECTSVIGKYGRSFIQGDVEDLQSELEDLLANPDVVEDYRSKSADYVCDKYRWSEVVAQTLELYRG